MGYIVRYLYRVHAPTHRYTITYTHSVVRNRDRDLARGFVKVYKACNGVWILSKRMCETAQEYGLEVIGATFVGMRRHLETRCGLRLPHRSTTKSYIFVYHL